MVAVIFSNKSVIDLDLIAGHIALDSPINAVLFIKKMRIHCKNLGQFPESHSIFSEVHPELRFSPHKRYIILYRFEKNEVLIERIIHSAQDILEILSN